MFSFLALFFHPRSAFFFENILLHVSRACTHILSFLLSEYLQSQNASHNWIAFLPIWIMGTHLGSRPQSFAPGRFFCRARCSSCSKHGESVCATCSVLYLPSLPPPPPNSIQHAHNVCFIKHIYMYICIYMCTYIHTRLCFFTLLLTFRERHCSAFAHSSFYFSFPILYFYALSFALSVLILTQIDGFVTDTVLPTLQVNEPTKGAIIGIIFFSEHMLAFHMPKHISPFILTLISVLYYIVLYCITLYDIIYDHPHTSAFSL